MGKNGWIPWEEAIAEAWDSFVSSHRMGRFAHLSGFKKTVEEVYRLRPNYWAYWRDGKILAVFPSFFHRSALYGRRIVSQPFSEYGGPLFSPGLEIPQKEAILREFSQVLDRSREIAPFDYLEVRCFADRHGLKANLFREERLYERGLLPLGRTGKLWDSVDYSVRKNLRRAKRHGLEIREMPIEESLRRFFYPLHLRSLKRLGSPPHPLSYFLCLAGHLRPRIRLLFAFLKEIPVAALLGWEVGRTVHITDIVSDERFFPLRGVDLLHYEMISRAVAAGAECFDFGPVRYPGQRQYKLKWGIELEPYAYFYAPRNRGRRPLSDRGALGRLGAAVWRRLPCGLSAKAAKPLRRMLAI